MGFLACLMFVLMLAREIKGFFGSKDVPKREVSFVETYARKEEVAAVARDLTALEGKLEHHTEELRKEMKADKDCILVAGEDRALEIHKRLNVLLEKVGELKGASDEQHRRMGL